MRMLTGLLLLLVVSGGCRLGDRSPVAPDLVHPQMAVNPSSDAAFALRVDERIRRRQEIAHRAVLESELRLWLSRANRKWFDK